MKEVRISIPQLDNSELSLARELQKESNDPRVQKLCRLVLDLEPKLKQAYQDLTDTLERARGGRIQ